MVSIFLFVVLSNVWATTEHPGFTVDSREHGASFEAIATPPAGHHFNIKAPMDALDAVNTKHYKPQKATEKQIVFTLPMHPKHKYDVNISLYLCDNANTYCEKHQVQMGQATAEAKPSASNKNLTLKIDEFGFIDNNFKAALNLAAKEKKPILIDFYGIWCPPL